MNGKKIIAVIIAVFVLVAGGTVGVMAATGVFRSDKTEAMELLAQVPERLSWSSVGEVIGNADMLSAVYEKGSVTDVSVSDIKFSLPDKKDSEELNDFFEGLTAAVSVQSDPEGHSGGNIKLEKNSTPVNFNYYMDGSEGRMLYASLPEIIHGKVFKLDMGETAEKTNFDVNTTRKFYEDLAAFAVDEMGKIGDEISCDKMQDGGYQLTVSKESLDGMLDDAVEFMEGQTEMVDMINAIGSLGGMYTSYKRLDDVADVDEKEDTYDFLAEMKKQVEEMKGETQDILLQVYGKDGSITSVKLADLEGEDKDMVVALDFSGEKGDSTATLKIGDAEDTLTVTKRDEKKELCTTGYSLELSGDGDGNGKLTYSQSINPTDNTCEIKMDVDAGIELDEEDQELWDEEGLAGLENIFPLSLTAKGSVKDLKQGSYADYVLDDVTLTGNGQDICTMAMDVKFGLQEGEVKPLEGEEVECNLDDDMTKLSETYGSEAWLAIFNIMAKWDLVSEDEMAGLMS